MGDRPVAHTGFRAPNHKFDKRFFVCYACTRSQGEKRTAFCLPVEGALWHIPPDSTSYIYLNADAPTGFASFVRRIFVGS